MPLDLEAGGREDRRRGVEGDDRDDRIGLAVDEEDRRLVPRLDLEMLAAGEQARRVLR